MARGAKLWGLRRSALQVAETGALCKFLELFLGLQELIYSPNFDYCPIGESDPSNTRISEELGPLPITLH